MVDGTKVVSAEVKEPFDTITGGYKRTRGRTYYRAAGSPEIGLAEAAEAELERRRLGLEGGGALSANENPDLLEIGAVRDVTLVELLERAWLFRARGSSNTALVEVMLAYSNTLDDLKKVQDIMIRLAANGMLEDEADLGSDLATAGTGCAMSTL